MEPEIATDRAAQIIDASGKLVCPGLVDLHAHVYPEVSAIGLPADELVPWTATTTYVSAGDAGSSTFSLFRHAIMARSRTRLLGFVHIANIGLAGFPVGEMLNIDNAIVELAAKTAAENRDVCLGIKVRMTAEVVGRNCRFLQGPKTTRELDLLVPLNPQAVPPTLFHSTLTHPLPPSTRTPSP